MADPRIEPGNDDAGVVPGRGSVRGTPRWVKVSGIVALALVLLLVIVGLTGIGGEHGPGRHLPSGGPGGVTPAPGIAERGGQPL